MRVYISGKITGLKEKEYIAKFVEAEHMLREHGHEPVNPIIIGMYNVPYDKCLEMDKILLSTCEAIYMLSDWKNSKGAKQEKRYAESLGLKIMFENNEDEMEDGISKMFARFKKKRARAQI